MIRLTEEKRISILNDYLDKKETNRLILLDMGAKAQLKKVVEWGDEDCPHTHDILLQIYSRRQCEECWQSLLEEVKNV